jgi:glycosyltransferase involved in cell wall biosynthesis
MAQQQLFVASDVGGHKELVRHGETGMLFRAGDAGALAKAVLDLLASPERWPALREAGRYFAESERSWKSSVARYRPVYASLVEAPGARRGQSESR